MRALRATDPREVGPYRLLAELGQGGMGRVLLGSGPDGRLVAVKVVHEQFAHDDEFRARFRREVEACRAVSGAYTAAVVDADPDAVVPWLASVFVAGPSLAETVGAVGALPEAAVLRLAAGLTTSLAHIHAAGLVHRDFKPANVLITDDGPRVIDFGIVRAVRDSLGEDLTRTGWLVGSPAFMSPEQADGGAVTSASDVFSLGSVVVAAATGVSPFTGTTTLRTLSNVVGLEPDLDDLPAAVRRIVRPCLAKDPGQRPSPAELLAAIGQIAPSGRPWPEPVHELIARRQAEVADFLEPGRDATVVMSGRPAGSTRVEPRAVVRARRWLAPVALVVAVAVAVGLGVVLWPSATETSTADPRRTTGSTTEVTAAPALERVGEITAPSAAEGLGFSPDGSVLSVRFDDDTVQSWAVGSQEQVGQIIGSFTGSGVGPPVFGADGRTVGVLRTEEQNAVVEQWDVHDGQRRGTPFVVALGEDDPLEGPLLGPGGRTMVATLGTYSDPRVHVWDVAGRRAVDGLGITGYVQGFSRDGRTLVVAQSIDHLHHVSLWDLERGRRLGEPVILPEGEFLRAFALGEDGRVLVTVSDNGRLRWWDTVSRNQTRQPVPFDDDEVDTIRFSPDGAHLVIIDESAAVRVLDVDTGTPVGAPLPEVVAVAFAEDGTLATAGSDDRIRLWRLPGR